MKIQVEIPRIWTRRGYAPDEIVLDPENDDFEDILIEQDIGLLEGELSEDGYTLISDEMIFEPGALELAS